MEGGLEHGDMEFVAVTRALQGQSSSSPLRIASNSHFKSLQSVLHVAQ